MSYKRALEQATHDLDALGVFIDNLTKPFLNRTPEEVKALGKGPSVIEELLRRGQHTPAADGYPKTDMGPETRGKGGHGDPTETAANDDSETRDLIGDALVEILSGLRQAVDVMGDVNQARTFVFSIQGKPYGRVNTVDLCTLCNDPAVKVRRIDGKPYHANTCYHRERRRRGEIGAVADIEDLETEDPAVGQ